MSKVRLKNGSENMHKGLYNRLQENPVIAAVTDEEKLKKALVSPCEVIFLLSGNIFKLKDTVKKVQEQNKEIYVHVDLLHGSSKDSTALDFIANEIKPDGIITTKTKLIKYANDLGLFAIQRLFLLDSLSLDTGIHAIRTYMPKAIEIMPGLIPSMIELLSKKTNVPIIAGGLISQKEHVIDGIRAGALGVSTSNESIWYS